MRVALGKFAEFGIKTRLGGDIAAAVADGLVNYTDRLNSEEPPVEIPRFCANQAPSGGGEALEVPLDPATEAALKEEARRQRVPVSQILTHAILVYLAGLDAPSAPEPDLLL